MNTLEEDEDLTRTLRALHARLDALEASFFSRVKDAITKPIKSASGDDMSGKGLLAHLKAAFPEMRMKALNQPGAENKWLMAYKGKTFLLMEMHMTKLVGTEWVFFKDPKILQFDEKNVDAKVSSYKAVDDYIRSRAP
jgi:hypothetical protein